MADNDETPATKQAEQDDLVQQQQVLFHELDREKVEAEHEQADEEKTTSVSPQE